MVVAMRPRLIATDLDGTFLGAESRPHPANIEAAHRIMEAGIEFVVATGRPPRWLEPITQLRELDPMVIGNNGASVGRLTAQTPDILHPVDPDLVRGFLDRIPAGLEPSIAVEYVSSWGREATYPGIQSEDQLVGDLDEILDAEPVLKVLARTEHADTDAWSEIAVEAAHGELECTFSWTDTAGTVELAAPGVSKGTALAELLRERGVDPAHVAAFGDMPNDLTMLHLVGHPFVMAGSHLSLFDRGFTEIGHHYDGAVGQQLLSWLDEDSREASA